MAIKYMRINVSREAKEFFMTKCMAEFLKHHPELEGCYISENHLFEQVIKFYVYPTGGSISGIRGV